MSRGHLAAAFAAATLALAAPATASADSFPLVGWWPLNEGSGQTVRDWSGRGNSGYLGSTTGADANDPSWIKGVFLGSALRFDGENDFVTIPTASSLEQQRLTVAAWVRANATPGPWRYVVSKGAIECQTASYGLYTGAGGGFAFYVADRPDHYFVTPEAPFSVYDGKWHHLAGTFDGKALKLFVDGRLIGSTAAETAIDYDLPDHSAQLGNYGGPCTNNLTLAGDVDGVQIWSQALPIDTIWRTLKSLFSLAK
jgi:Concanavalin A-like lectin/glucanases superfamily